MSIVDRHIPGTIEVEGREYLYISDNGEDFFTKSSRTTKKQSLFDKVTSLFEIAQSGGVISENCKLKLPTDELFHGVSYKGDIEGWRKQIEQGAEQLGLLTGKILENKIELSDGRIYTLLDCQVEFY
ncbi:hypothetical protein CKY20_11055 [Capnocytophaga canis]|uniref:Uncharacterized protein n=1 Tax=Capnocytophaga canis TaxID=1848903 RepID=A0A3A1YDJ5_9FLAO|nr:hypothetical protein [Capnocytophaga canis]RIY35240.1 hypothetical protein CKY20_11055 [Capnocytophaga canis]